MVTDKQKFIDDIMRMMDEAKKQKEQERRKADRDVKDYISDNIRKRSKWKKKKFYH